MGKSGENREKWGKWGKMGKNGEKWNQGRNLEYAYDIFNKDIIFLYKYFEYSIKFYFLIK